MARQAASGFRTPIHTSLPASPVDGQEIRFLADAANGIVWTLRYRAASSSAYKWEFVGGSELSSEAAGHVEATASFASLGGPSIVVPLAGDYMIEWGGRLYNSNAAGADARMAVFIAGVQGSMLNHFQGSLATSITIAASNDARKAKALAVAAAATLECRYAGVGGGVGAFEDRWMSARPVRVG